MKKIFFMILALILANIAIAQSMNDFGKIVISVVMPENVDGMEFSQISKLETKISQIVIASGIAASGFNNNFVIYPKFEIYESNIVEGGMQNITVIKAELSLFIKQVDNNILFSSTTISLNGSGSNKQQAISNAISKIQTNDSKFETFIETGKSKIILYYETKCADIIRKADSYLKMQQFEQALGLLLSVPEEVTSCSNEIHAKTIEAFKVYQTQRCAELIQKTKIMLASNNYAGSLNILSEIDPSSSCFKEAQTLAKIAELKVDAEEKKQWDFQMKQYSNDVSLEKQRIEAAKEIVVSYYKSQPKTITYNYLVR